MKRFLDASKRKLRRPKKTKRPKKTGAAFEAGERAVRDGLSGARGPKSILSVVVAPKRENGVMESSILYWFYKVFRMCGNTVAE